MGKWNPPLPGGALSLESIEVNYTLIGGIKTRLFTDPKMKLQLRLDPRQPLQSLLPMVAGNMGTIQTMLRELVTLRDRLCALENTDPPPYVDTEEELEVLSPASTAGENLLPSE